MLYERDGFCCAPTRISHRGTRVPRPEPRSLSILDLSVAPQHRLRAPCFNSTAFFVNCHFGSLSGMLTLLPFKNVNKTFSQHSNLAIKVIVYFM